MRLSTALRMMACCSNNTWCSWRRREGWRDDVVDDRTASDRCWDLPGGEAVSNIAWWWCLRRRWPLSARSIGHAHTTAVWVRSNRRCQWHGSRRSMRCWRIVLSQRCASQRCTQGNTGGRLRGAMNSMAARVRCFVHDCSPGCRHARLTRGRWHTTTATAA